MAAKLANIVEFYREGFRSMRIGRLLWKIILLKLALIYALAKFWFPDYLQTHYATDEGRAAHVLDELTENKNVMTENKVRPVPGGHSLTKGKPDSLAAASGFTSARK